MVMRLLFMIGYIATGLIQDFRKKSKKYVTNMLTLSC